ncbi:MULTISPECIES: cytochrome aa3 quinol oxidase subunit IV [unclassified Paenibacillus]|uniref:cytochrome aa3 quinol oxidase subunit IV n=1 Tax=unclassified Paenibacillus TaxID=185978 RepID=UPI0004F90DAF|nr:MULTISPECIES: cytochrome aa3 quinol oxidase subunit IV [unclassified Paenibacillus]AIQ45214.1 cytochrome aa3 quinol oxidase subunit IV [Paenibacillus sp. FSL R7-0273]AIQ50836.1 cytochrome aa3 quinol oxidase subunit IV [Paenibacillus sp. FSL R7-0331]MDF9842455.1 cytochrome aa3-600 menaquinol oxidase subunit 4 [Paenibacillus sp. PastF-2]MDF9849045.1 cytochrome aa3-600 menaquinol oxidase subunit 4 [Paenibacillus sp. PastM-2]MDF9855615.1 cytochrome aa3-600 menaquinol oxidase subunit 4 [Paenibac
MIKQLFPIRHVMGYLASLVLSAAALIVIYGDLSHTANVVVLTVTALIQASLQLFVFMHIGESADTKKELYLNIAYALFVGLITLFGTLFIFVWGWYA